MANQDQISGSVERVTYYNEENGYCVLRLKPDNRGMLPFKYASGRDELITVVGNLPEVQPGEWLKLLGQWGNHAKHGRQFQAEFCEQSLPATTEGIKRYLGSGLIRGIGPVMAERIVNRFGDETLNVIEYEPERLLTVLGVGRKRVGQIAKAWDEQRAIKDVMIFLQSHGVSTNLATKIYKKYGDTSLAIVQNSPYQMVRDIHGIGFKTADKIARALGLAVDDPARIEAGIAYTLNRMAEEGHVYMPQEELEPEAAQILGVEAEKVTAVIDALETNDFIKRETIRYSATEDQVASGKWQVAGKESPISNLQSPILREERAVYLTPLYYSEIGVTKRVQQMIAHPTSRLAVIGHRSSVIGVGKQLPNVPISQLPITLAPQQLQAIETAVTHKVTILTGGPGTGKCVTGDTYVLTDKGCLPIRELQPVENMAPDTTLPISMLVHTRTGLKEATHFYYGGEQDTIRITTAEMYEIEGTCNHRVIVATENGPMWKHLNDITTDDFVGIFRPPPAAIFDLHPFAYFLGLFVGDGHAEKRKDRPTTGVNITTADEEVWAFLETEMPKMNFTCNLHGYSGKARNYYIGRRQWHGQGGVAAEMQSWGCALVKSREKTVPARILQGSMVHKCSFLMGLFDADATVDKRDGSVELGLSNLHLLRQVQLLMLDFGIISVIRPKPQVDAWRLSIRGEDARRFFDYVGFHIKRKQALRVALSDKPNPNRDVVPCLGTGLLRRYIAQTGKHDRKWWWKWKREVAGVRHPSRGRVLTLIGEFPLQTTEAIYIRALCDETVYWAQVSVITSSYADVYDLHVPNGNEFIANGFINHNTTTLRALLDLLDKHNLTCALASPTGRAAKRLAEATGREAKTIHRLLEFNPGEGFGRNEENPINADIVVIDEASMLDLVLANNLLKAIRPDSHLLLVGDIDQLPSVGAGDVLADLIESGVTAVVRLQTIFRQAAGSHIISNAHRINQGQMPETPKEANDFFLFVVEEPDKAAEMLVDVVQNRVPQKFGFDPLDDVQVLAPMYNGAAGVSNLNLLLQAALNPPSAKKPERKLSGRLFRAGDKVMQTVNNYDKSVYNGDIGRITAMDLIMQTMTVSIDGAPVVYDFLEADELVHAYAISVHKSQGAEYPCVVLPMHTQHYLMLQRNLLYTAVTRAKKVVILVGTRKAIHIAVKNDKVTQRHTALDWRLQR